MKLLDLALKDLLRSFRGLSFWAFGLAVPLLVSSIFYFAFGGLGSDGGGLDVPSTAVWVVNLDAPPSVSGGFSAGQVLVDVLKSDGLSGLLTVTESADPAAARSAVDAQRAGVAVIIPAGFTAAAVSGGQAAVEVYRDPTLTLGPGIVQGIVREGVDGLAGSAISAGVAGEELAARGLALDAAAVRGVAAEYAGWATALGLRRQQGADPLLEVRSPAARPRPGGETAGVIPLIMAGMMVFFVFFTGAAMAQTILEEEEAGTLARLFTTPTPRGAVLGGKLIASLATLTVQVAALLAVSALVFGVNWGRPEAVALVALVLIGLAASFGLYVTSLLKNMRQGSIIYGGVLTMMGMLGMINVFTAQAPGGSGASFGRIALLVPQGWAVHAWQVLLAGGGVLDVLGTVLVMLALAVLFFWLGLLRFRRRFA